MLQALRSLLKTKWRDGFTIFFKLRRVKQLVMSINDPANFLSFANEIIDLCFVDRAEGVSAGAADRR